MSLLFMILSYCFIACMLLRPIAGHIAWSLNLADFGKKMRQWEMDRLHYSRSGYPAPKLMQPSLGQWSGAVSLSLFLVLVWPLCAAWSITNRRLFWMGNEREGQLKMARARIKELESV